MTEAIASSSKRYTKLGVMALLGYGFIALANPVIAFFTPGIISHDTSLYVYLLAYILLFAAGILMFMGREGQTGKHKSFVKYGWISLLAFLLVFLLVGPWFASLGFGYAQVIAYFYLRFLFSVLASALLVYQLVPEEKRVLLVVYLISLLVGTLFIQLLSWLTDGSSYILYFLYISLGMGAAILYLVSLRAALQHPYTGHQQALSPLEKHG